MAGVLIVWFNGSTLRDVASVGEPIWMPPREIETQIESLDLPMVRWLEGKFIVSMRAICETGLRPGDEIHLEWWDGELAATFKAMVIQMMADHRTLTCTLQYHSLEAIQLWDGIFSASVPQAAKPVIVEESLSVENLRDLVADAGGDGSAEVVFTSEGGFRFVEPSEN